MRKPRAFITGICGFAGSHLAEELLNHGYDVCGGRFKNESTANINHIKKDITLDPLDISNPQQCIKLLGRIKPDYIFHLAAMASVGKSFGLEQATMRVNIEGTLSILDAAKKSGKLKQLIFVGSADCYGKFTPKTRTLTEDQPLNPATPYAISKAAAEQPALYYYRQYRLPVTIARSFNHAGPRQDDRFVIASFAKQVAMIEARLQRPVMNVGDLTAKRDFSDVRDIVRGYRLLAERGRIGEIYHFCSGRAVTVQRALDILIDLSNRKIAVKVGHTCPERQRQKSLSRTWLFN